MLQIKEISTAQLTTLNHSPRVFHDALALVKKGETRFHVVNPAGEDYELAYTHNMDLYTDQIKAFIMAMTCDQDLHPDFLDYDEDDKDNLCLEFLSQFDRAEFEWVDEYTVTIARIILKFTNMPVVFKDKRILWFMDEEARLTVTDHFEETIPQGTLRVTPNPVELGKTKLDCSHYVIEVPSEEFMAYAKSIGASPSSLLFQLTVQTLQRQNPDNQLPLRTFIPVSVRTAMDNPGSLLHQVVHTTYDCDPDLLTDDSRAADLNQGFRTHLKGFSARENLSMMCGVYRGIIEAYKKAITANMLDKIRENNSSVNISTGASFIGRLAAGDYGSRIHMECIRVMPGHDFHTYMLEAGRNFYISMTLGARTDRYVRDMADHMRSLGMTHTCWREV